MTQLGDRTLISTLNPSVNEDLLEQLSKQGATAFALDCIPRMLSRGQTFDVLSSQANIAGYRAVVEASNVFGRFFAGQMTAAGKVPPAKVLVLGAGVAGLAAIQTAKNMGAVVKAYDVRPVVAEQVESLGGQFLRVPYEEDGSGAGGYAKEMSDAYKAAEQQLMCEAPPHNHPAVALAEVARCRPAAHCALLAPSQARAGERRRHRGDDGAHPQPPGAELIKQEMVDAMRRGSVIVDLAAENGGNARARRRTSNVTPNGVVPRVHRPGLAAAGGASAAAATTRQFLLDRPADDGERASTTSTTRMTPSAASPSARASCVPRAAVQSAEVAAARRRRRRRPSGRKKRVVRGEAHRIVGAPHRHGHVGRPAARRPPHDVCALRPRRLAGRRRRPSGAPLAAHVGH